MKVTCKYDQNNWNSRFKDSRASARLPPPPGLPVVGLDPRPLFPPATAANTAAVSDKEDREGLEEDWEGLVEDREVLAEAWLRREVRFPDSSAAVME